MQPHDTKPNENSAQGAENQDSTQELERAQSPAVKRAARDYGPHSMLRQAERDMERLFRSFFGPSSLRWAGFEPATWSSSEDTSYWPEIEVKHSENKLVVCADIPGLSKDDVKVEVRDNQLCISGERRTESKRNEAGYYRTERSYGSFCRTIALPDGAKPETASARFENGVLKVEMEAPTTEPQARRIEVH